MKKPFILFVSLEEISNEVVLRQLVVASLYKHYGSTISGKTGKPITGEILVVVGNQNIIEDLAKQYGPDTTITSLLDVVTGTNFKSFTTPLSLAQYVVGILEPSQTSTKVRKALETVPFLQPGFMNPSWSAEQVLTKLLTTENSFIFLDQDQFMVAEAVTRKILNGLTVTEEKGFKAVITGQTLPSKTAATAWVTEKQIPVLSRTTPSIWGVEENAVVLPKSLTLIAKGILKLDTLGYATTQSHKKEVFTSLAVAYSNAVATGEIVVAKKDEVLETVG